MDGALSAVENIYFSIQSSLNDMLAACHTDDERNTIRTKYIAARQNYWQCINKTFHEDDPEVQALVTQAKSVSTDIKNISDKLGDISKVIDVLSVAVSVGSQIASKVITL